MNMFITPVVESVFAVEFDRIKCPIDAAPADSPKIVIRSLSPPKFSMLVLTHSRAATRSRRAWLPGASGIPEVSNAEINWPIRGQY